MYNKMITEVYKNGKLEQTLICEDLVKVQESFIEDLLANKFQKNNRIEQAGYDRYARRRYRSIYYENINGTRYRTERTYIKEGE